MSSVRILFNKQAKIQINLEFSEIKKPSSVCNCPRTTWRLHLLGTKRWIDTLIDKYVGANIQNITAYYNRVHDIDTHLIDKQLKASRLLLSPHYF